MVENGRTRVVIEGVAPEIDDGRFPIKRTVGETVSVEADVFADGHDVLACQVLYRREVDNRWEKAAMQPLGNDRWRGEFSVQQMGRYRYTVRAWVDHFATLQHHLRKKRDVGQEVEQELRMAAQLLDEAAGRAQGRDAERLRGLARELAETEGLEDRIRLVLDDDVRGWAGRYPADFTVRTYERELVVVVDRDKARFSTWYELFPRSTASEPGKHGTFRDTAARLPYVASMGFDVLYLPPIHPIGVAYRKGPNNKTEADPDDPGSPWAIGAAEGGHRALHPQLGTLDDFRYLVDKAHALGLEIALDIAWQCAPDHPYVKEHPEWFRHRPDGTIQYAENPPKKYQDIYPFDFECDDWQALWQELKGVTLHWVQQGIRIFRVDNPHTKAFPFWEWLIAEVKAVHPDVLFLAEAFTRPKVMYRLAKLGFTQSYNYFAWRHTKDELTRYFTELTRTDLREYFRPNLWPNTPDILTEFLQYGGPGAFNLRFVLAATLGASFGIYGPPFELCIGQAREPGSEEYLDSEKYQIRHWDLQQTATMRHLIARINRIRRENRALQNDHSLTFHHVANDQILCYSKQSPDGNAILVAVNLDPHHAQSGMVDVPLEHFGLNPDDSFQVHDLLSDARYLWQGRQHFVGLDPAVTPAHIFRIRRRFRREQDFEYYF